MVRYRKMPDLTDNQIYSIEEAMVYPNGPGYVLDFSNRTIAMFFEDEFGIDIYAEQYAHRGSSKRNHLISFLLDTDTHTALKVLRALWERREGLLAADPDGVGARKARAITPRFKQVIGKLETSPDQVRTDGVDRFSEDRTLEELIASIRRTLEANKPEAAFDHLHTYCTKRITHLLSVRGIDCSEDEPLHSRFGKYRKALMAERDLHDFTDRALKSSISLMESFNDLRNNKSLAHDNELLGPFEARFVCNVINEILLLIRALEADRYSED